VRVRRAADDDRVSKENPNPIIHSTKLFGGQVTAEELHARLAWGDAVCTGCRGRPCMRVQIFIRLVDMSPDECGTANLGISLGSIKPVKLPSGHTAIVYSRAFACGLCKRALERVAAKAPSYAIVDISYGPGPDKALVAVPHAVS
jgi:hypothetical protein